MQAKLPTSMGRTHCWLLVCLVSLTSGFVARSQAATDQASPLGSDQIAEVRVEGLPQTQGGWLINWPRQSIREPMTPALARKFLEGSLGSRDVRNAGRNWSAGLAIKLAKPQALRQVVVERGTHNGLSLETVTVLAATEPEPGVLQWQEVKTVTLPADQVGASAVRIELGTQSPQLWWAVRCRPAVAPRTEQTSQHRGVLSIAGVKFYP